VTDSSQAGSVPAAGGEGAEPEKKKKKKDKIKWHTIDDDIDEDDYYALLCLSDKQMGSSEAEMKERYRKLCLIYHPDKVEAEKRERVEKRFLCIQKGMVGALGALSFVCCHALCFRTILLRTMCSLCSTCGGGVVDVVAQPMKRSPIKTSVAYMRAAWSLTTASQIPTRYPMPNFSTYMALYLPAMAGTDFRAGRQVDR
jgi:hypothetical protein